MSFRKFNQELKENTIKNVCLLHGREQFLVEWAKNALIKKYANDVSKQFDVTILPGTEVSAERIIEVSETLPVFSDRRVVVVEDFSLLEGVKNKNMEEDGAERLLAYLEVCPKETILIFTCGEKPDRRRKLFKSMQKLGSVYEFGALEMADLRQWVVKRFHTYGKQIGRRELERLIELSGYFDRDSEYTLYHFDNDISKVVLHSGGEMISMEDVEQSVSGNINTNVFQLIEYISVGDKRRAFDLLTDLFLYGETEYGLLALIYRQYENILSVKQLSRRGKSSKEIADLLGAKEFVVTKSLRVAGKYDENRLKKVLMDIYQADKNIKSGNMEGRMAVELLIAFI